MDAIDRFTDRAQAGAALLHRGSIDQYLPTVQINQAITRATRQPIVHRIDVMLGTHLFDMHHSHL
jgi:hypothetical protein